MWKFAVDIVANANIPASQYIILDDLLVVI